MKRKFEIEINETNNYTIPVIKKQSNKWFIEFYYHNKRHRYSFNVNRIKNLREREKQLNFYRATLEHRLLNNWVPGEESESEPINNTFKDSLLFALEKKKPNVRSSTYEDYSTSLQKFISEAKMQNISELNVKDISRKDILTVMESLTVKNKWSNKTYNKNLGNIRSLFSILVEWEYIEINVCRDIKVKKISQSSMYEPADNTELKNIKEHLQQSFSNLWDFVFFMFQTGLRPNEILSIKINMIDMNNRIITLPKEFIKTNRKRTIPIDDFIYEWLDKKDLKLQNQSHYLFGTKRSFRNKGVSNETDLTIAETQITRKAVSKYWERKVMKPLNIDVKLYSFKHLTANKRLEAGQSLDEIQHLFGHTSKAMTKVYANHIESIYTERLKSNKLDLNNLN